ncbi:MAG: FAD-binding protein [Bacteroidales bacterium]|nr:FAD-binding protein [Bacteroidales bacterium]
MESEIIRTDRFSVRYCSLNTLIIGSGAASLNAAVSLHSMGVEDIMIVTAELGGGTSNNAGSDKQTYYKLSLAGGESDSVREMAQDLFDGKCMHGDISLCEAQGSVQAFIKLVGLGVPFPRDKYGSFAGYKTDNDPRARATSAGPYTSGMIVKALAGEVHKRNIKVLDNHQVVELLTSGDGSRIIGAIAIDTMKLDPFDSFVVFNTVNIILGTGGPGEMYEDSVYPLSQTGSPGMAYRAGAAGQNLTESQFGIASMKFRWNLSGSYQQVIPRYFSTDSSGKDEREFLNDHFEDYRDLTRAIFLKGYQWPFDPLRIADSGSSLIDLLIWQEKVQKGRMVFIDYRKNLTWEEKETFDRGELDPAARDYLESSASLQETPLERLLSINRPAYELYRDHGIDLASEPLEIGICAQHNNGGLKANIWWESDLKHLFPVGEVNGSHGVARPGGSALNSGQAGSFRAAEFISRRYNSKPPDRDEFMVSAGNGIKQVFDTALKWLGSPDNKSGNQILSEMRHRMSYAAGIIRDRQNINEASEEAASLFKSAGSRFGASSTRELAACFRISDLCLTHFIYLEAIRHYIEEGGRSRGSYIVTGGVKSPLKGPAGNYYETELCRYDRDVESSIQEARFVNGKVSFTSTAVREVPEQNLWFEKVWKEYLEDNYIGDRDNSTNY